MIDIDKELQVAYDAFMDAPHNSEAEEKCLATLCGWVNLYSEVYGVSREAVSVGLVLNSLINNTLSEVSNE